MNKELENRRFVTLENFSNLWTAEVVKNRLLEEGIHAFILNENINYSFGPTFLEGFRLQVDQSQFLKALNIYKNSLQDL
ncbi:putative signal transducing protein [Moheibacter lacus]|uniref:DUF2007 domain-containing protein n=1 Tax=Moheibacter lacus TaxID=2745851 RepID=A0A838ZQT4_9FLAO|nr:DUF2007 domain-containing protein [Moheibacter lacus]MBA5628432.1 DUF2007 domain-containing protein [Moheibacter lacus]